MCWYVGIDVLHLCRPRNTTQYVSIIMLRVPELLIFWIGQGMSIIGHYIMLESKKCFQNPNDPQAAEKFQEMAAAFVPAIIFIPSYLTLPPLFFLATKS
jgi:hypothetical protein